MSGGRIGKQLAPAVAILTATASLAQDAAPPTGGTAYADLTIEQLMELKVERVYGASRHVQKVTHAPSSVSIVTADEIRRFGWRTLGEVLRSMRGIQVADDRNYAYVGVRGFQRPGDYNTRVLVLIDGHRMNDAVYDGSYVGRDTIDPALIERVELIRGPSSSIYGSSAFFSVVNVVTKRPGQFADGEAAFSAGNLGTYDGRLSFGRNFRNGVEWLVSGSYHESTGESEIYFPEFDPRRSTEPGAANNGVAEDVDGERAAQAFTRVTYRELTISAFINRRRKDIPTASFGTLFNHPAARTVDRRGYIDAKLDHAFGANDARLLGRVFYDRYRYNGWYPYDYAAPGEPLDLFVSPDGANAEWAGTEWQVNLPLSAQHSLIGGFEFRHSFHEDQFAETGDPATDLHDHRTTRNLGVFAQWEAEWRKNLRLTAGVRYDHYFRSFGGTLNPRVGIIYNPTETSALKLLYGRAFRAPTSYERFYYIGQALQPPLRPERVRTSEVVYARYWGANYRMDLSAYFYEAENLITQAETTTFDLYFHNADSTEARGVEAEFEATYESGWRGRVSYALQRSKERVSGAELSSSPRGLGRLHLSWSPPQHGFSAGLEAQYQSSVRTLAGARAAAFLVVNLHLRTTTLIPGCEVSATAGNLFEERYSYPGAGDHLQDIIPQPGRLLRLEIIRRF